MNSFSYYLPMFNLQTKIGRDAYHRTGNYPVALALDSLARHYIHVPRKIITPGRRSKFNGDINASGDPVCDIDAETHEFLSAVLTDRGYHVLSEESRNDDGLERPLHHANGLLIALDPVDGSSATHTATAPYGMIAGVYRELGLLRPGLDLMAAMTVTVGREIEALVAYPGCGTYRYSWDQQLGLWTSGEGSRVYLPHEAKIEMVGGMRKDLDDKQRAFLENADLGRFYARCLAADTNYLLTSDLGGLFIHPRAKLRLLYELLPILMLIEEAGGAGYLLSGNQIQRYREYVWNTDPHDKSAVVFGCEKTVRDFLSDTRDVMVSAR